MQYALISPDEKVKNSDGTVGCRVCEAAFTQFEVAPPLFWVECDTMVSPDNYYYDNTSKEIRAKPTSTNAPGQPSFPQPTTDGAQSF